METLKRNNPNLNLSQFFDDLVKEENEKQQRCNIFPFKELKEEGWRGVNLENEEEEKQFDIFFGLNEYYYDELGKDEHMSISELDEILNLKFREEQAN